MVEGKKEWYVLRVISGKEAKVKELLDASIKNTGISKYLSQVLIPTERVYTTRNGKKVLKERNRFSGYVFVEAHLTGEIIHELRNTTNVIDFLGAKRGSMPEALRKEEVSRMMGDADEHLEVEDGSVNDYVVGETVKVNFGPFSGFSGDIEEVNKEKRKLKVMVKVFGRKTALELEISQVERE